MKKTPRELEQTVKNLEEQQSVGRGEPSTLADLIKIEAEKGADGPPNSSGGGQ